MERLAARPATATWRWAYVGPSRVTLAGRDREGPRRWLDEYEADPHAELVEGSVLLAACGRGIRKNLQIVHHVEQPQTSRDGATDGAVIALSWRCHSVGKPGGKNQGRHGNGNAMGRWELPVIAFRLLAGTHLSVKSMHQNIDERLGAPLSLGCDHFCNPTACPRRDGLALGPPPGVNLSHRASAPGRAPGGPTGGARPPRCGASRTMAPQGVAASAGVEHGHEGRVAKDPASPYVGGRTLKWLKVKQLEYHVEERGWDPGNKVGHTLAPLKRPGSLLRSAMQPRRSTCIHSAMSQCAISQPSHPTRIASTNYVR